MARRPKPWYWKARKTWCVYLNGEKILLGPDRDAAFTRYHEIMAKPPEKHHPIDRGCIAVMFDDFLTWTEENRARKTYTRYRDFIQSFVNEFGRAGILSINSSHVTAWLNAQLHWNSTTKRNAITALQRAFNWAVKNRGLEKNPIRGMEKPKAKRRTAIVTAGQFEELLQYAEDIPFSDLLIVSYDCGTRPQETKQLEARHIQLDKRRAIIPAEEAKGKITRAIYFPTEKSFDIISRLVKEYPTGPLFRNGQGNAWTAFSVKLRFERIQIAEGLREMKSRGIQSEVTEEAIEKLARTLPKIKKNRCTGHETKKKDWELRQEAKRKLIAKEAKQYARRFRQYDFRHSFVTRKLRAGVDSHVVAALVGHKDTKMIDTVYSHVADDYEFMLEAAKKDPLLPN